MRKLKLDLDALQVEAFDTEAQPAARGTVAAHDSESKESLCYGMCNSTEPTQDPYNAYCTWEACSNTWCYNSCWTDC
jgi:hypothetical protein